MPSINKIFEVNNQIKHLSGTNSSKISGKYSSETSTLILFNPLKYVQTACNIAFLPLMLEIPFIIWK